MTDLMEFLYSYTLTSRFPGYLNTEDYHGTDAPPGAAFGHPPPGAARRSAAGL